jgi:hypothetical protein
VLICEQIEQVGEQRPGSAGRVLFALVFGHESLLTRDEHLEQRPRQHQ